MHRKILIQGLWVPLITPFFRSDFDSESMTHLIKNLEPFVEGFVPCLSSGEGEKMNKDLWEKVLETVAGNTQKPVIAGIFREDISEILQLAEIAKKHHCIAIAIALKGESDMAKSSFVEDITKSSFLPMLIYNTVKNSISKPETLKEISHQNVIGIKDSSQNQVFFDALLDMKKKDLLDISILQGMENQLLSSVGCDGYLISLANAEPKLCKDMFLKPSKELNDIIMEKWNQLDLGSDNWYVNIKENLFSKGIIKSKELI